MNGRFKLLALIAIIVMLGATGAAFAAPPRAPNATGQDQVCPHDTDGWSSHQEGGFTAIQGAINYCAKGGNVEHSECTGYLVTGSYDEVLAVINAAGACGLSHWSYQLGGTPKASVTVTPGPCYWDGASYFDVVVDITGAGTITITGPGGPFIRTGDDTLTLTSSDYDWSFVPAEGYELEGPGSGSFEVGTCEPETDPASVSVSIGPCNQKSGYLTPVIFDITGAGTFSINGSDYTSDGSVSPPEGTYVWAFAPAEGYHLVGPGSGSITVLNCEPPPPGGASGSLAPLCDLGIDVVLANSLLYIDDFDPITESGFYPFNIGEHSFFWEALQGFEFPEGFDTEGVFTIEKCGPPIEPPTGPESTLPIAAGVTLLGSIGLLVIGAKRFLRK